MQKRLVRDSKNKKIAGVCAGIANYFDVDPTLIRILWVILSFGFGSGIVAYFFCWLIMPED